MMKMNQKKSSLSHFWKQGKSLCEGIFTQLSRAMNFSKHTRLIDISCLFQGDDHPQMINYCALFSVNDP